MPNVPKNIRPSYLPKKEVQERRTFVNKRYHTSRWRKLRANIIANEPLCRECDRNGLTTLAQMVDHINPVSTGVNEANQDYLMWSADNLQPLCNRCHNKKSGQESHEPKEY